MNLVNQSIALSVIQTAFTYRAATTFGKNHYNYRTFAASSSQDGPDATD